MLSIAYFLGAIVLSLVLSRVVGLCMHQFGIVDAPRSKKRKIHTKKIPLGGGLGIFFSFCILVWFGVAVGDLGTHIPLYILWGLVIGGGVLMIGGLLDDRYVLKPRFQIIFPIAAAIVALSFGVGLHVVTNPFTPGVLQIDTVGIVNGLITLADIVAFFWLMGMMFTTKFLDGLDGLVAGVVAIGGILIFFLSRQPQWQQPEVALLALLLSGACIGFLVWNWHPAKLFLGEGGSLFTGFLLGALAMISGGKIATTLLVMGVPALDVLRVIVRRWQLKRPIYEGDSEHLHYKLLDSGLSHRRTVLLFYSIALLFGMTTLFLQSRQKMMALILLLILMMLVGLWFSRKDAQDTL